jgi:hypothetical protein
MVRHIPGTAALVLTGLALLQCGGKEGPPTANDSYQPSALCASEAACVDGCYAKTTTQIEFNQCADKCGRKTTAGTAQDVWRGCDKAMFGTASCRDRAMAYEGAFCLEALKPGMFHGDSVAVPAELFATWKGATSTLVIRSDRTVTYENYMTLEGCRVDEHLEGVATMHDEGLVLEFAAGEKGPSIFRFCDGETIPRDPAHSLVSFWLSFKVVETTQGIRLAIEEYAKGGLTTEWGDDFFYRVP